jgi:hypothetical protein
MDSAMLGLFRPLEKYVGPQIVTVSDLCHVLLLGCVLKFSSKFVCIPFVEYNFIVIWILEFYYLD